MLAPDKNLSGQTREGQSGTSCRIDALAPTRRPHKEGVSTMVAVQRTNDQPPVSSGALDPLDQVADRAYAALGPCNGRLARAVAMVRSGAVTLLPSGYVEVQSQSTD